MEDEKIKIVGHGPKLFDFAAVKDTVVKIQGLYYRRDSTEVVRVKDASGKLRYFREKSPLIVRLPNGTYLLKELAMLTEDGVWLEKNSDDVVTIQGKIYRKAYCVQVNNEWCLRTDPRLVQDKYTGKGSTLIFKTDAVALSKEYYGQDQYTHKDNPNLLLYNDEYHLVTDCVNIWSFKLNKPVKIPSRVFANVQLATLYYDFQDKTNPQEDRLLAINVPAQEMTPDNVLTIALIPPEYGNNIQITIPRSLKEYFEHAIENFIIPRHMTKNETVRATINKNFSDLDDKENVAKAFKYIARPFPGKQELFRPRNYPQMLRSRTFEFTGGLRYSFGVEFETSQGYLSEASATAVDLFMVGDRSIGSAEYVTAPMMGDAGVNRLEEQCKMLNACTLVDDRCGIHVHVGSMFNPTAKKPEPGPKDAPTFSKNFLINSINLGAYLEEELYTAMPKNRKPTLYHCHSIRRWAGTNDSNFDVNMGAFVFGQKELWYAEDKTPIKPFDFTPYKLGKTYNSNKSVGQWAEGRYKWLNLIHSYTKSKHRTIEFRIFSATTVFEKVYAYLLTSLAFTYVADNVPSIIKPGVTLSQVFAAAFKNYPDLQTFLNTFYDERKAKFNRKNLYPKDHPYLLLK